MPENVTAVHLIGKYAADIAFVAEREPATSLSDFADQLRTAAVRLDRSGVNGGDELDTAALYLFDADAAFTSGERQALLNKAAEYLKDTGDMVAEYRLMA